MTTLTQDQETALAAIATFMTDHDATIFLLEGGAGTGKTFLLGQLLQRYTRGVRCCCTPTHKATNVLRRKLEAFGVDWCRGFDPYSYDGHDVITGTTAALLGVAPVVDDDQGAKEMKFGKTGNGMLTRITPELLVIDEVSMLSWRDLQDLIKHGKARGMKIIAVGDAGQLPPVKQQPIPFGKFKHKASLRQIVRQAEGSAIVDVAWAIREDRPWRELAGAGLTRTDKIGDAFIAAVQAPGERPEEDREVFIAYRNRRVDEVQNRACDKLYGHDGNTFAPGELVLSETNFYEGKTLVCANQDELMVREFHEEDRDPTTGVPVTLAVRGHDGRRFRASYLSSAELANKSHPYNVELKTRLDAATNLQTEFKRLKSPDSRRRDVDSRRKQAWVEYFKWRDQTIITFRHPFALTSHKSQGSTYKSVFADVVDLGRFGKHALYVAVTRPRETLVVNG